MNENHTDPWQTVQELREVAEIMDFIVANSKRSREMLKQQGNEHYTDNNTDDQTPLPS